MSSNLAVINFAVGGKLVVSGKTTLAETVLSSSSMDIQGLTTTSLNTTVTSTFTSLPISSQTPILDNQLTTKVYVNTVDGVVNKRITDTDADQRIYIDASYNALNKRITDTDALQKKYIDDADGVLNDRITKTDTDQKTFIDKQISDIKVKPIFYVFQSVTSTQSVPNNAMTKIRYFENVYNVFSRYTNSEYLFQPAAYPGYYQLNATVCLPNITSGYIAIFKDGVEYSRGTSFLSTSTSPDTTLSISTVMCLKDGALDYNEADVRVICSPSVVIGSQSKIFFTGSFIQLQ
jgi:hypothetical protein